MLNTIITATPPSLAAGYCWTNPQQFANDLVGGITFLFNTDVGNSFFNTGASVPSAANRLFPWLDAASGRWYQWSSVYGIWISPFWPLASSKKRILWVGSLADLVTEDGGNTNPVSIIDGPFWEEDTDFIGRSPMGPGAIPTSTPAKVLSVGENYGNGSQMQTDQQLAAHKHALAADASIQNGANIKVVQTGTPGPGLQIGLTGTPSTDLSISNNTFTTTQEGIPIIHPVRGCYLIKRTIRQFYTLGP